MSAAKPADAGVPKPQAGEEKSAGGTKLWHPYGSRAIAHLNSPDGLHEETWLNDGEAKVFELEHKVSGRKESHVPVEKPDGSLDFLAGKSKFHNPNGSVVTRDSRLATTDFIDGTTLASRLPRPVPSASRVRLPNSGHFQSISLKFPDGVSVVTRISKSEGARIGYLIIRGRHHLPASHRNPADAPAVFHDFALDYSVVTHNGVATRYHHRTGAALSQEGDLYTADGGMLYNPRSDGRGVMHWADGTWKQFGMEIPPPSIQSLGRMPRLSGPD